MSERSEVIAGVEAGFAAAAAEVWEAALSTPELRDVAAALAKAGIGSDEVVRAAARAHEFAAPELERIRRDLRSHGFAAEDGRLERFILLQAASECLPAIDDLPVAPEVKALYAAALSFMVEPGEPERGGLEPRIGHSHFASMCKVVTLRRFPAGQWDWEVSGVLRSWFLHIGARRLPGLAWYVLRELRGLRPLLNAHFSVCRKQRLVLSRSEVHASWLLMADALARQPAVLGFVEHSWLVSEDVHRINPHLAWVNDIFRENGAYIAPLGAAGADSGIYHGVGARRREQFAEAGIVPRLGLVLWSRRRILDWASRHA